MSMRATVFCLSGFSYLSASIIGLALALAHTGGDARADEPANRTCAARVAEAEFDLEERREDEKLAPILSGANQAIFDLLEPLWEAKSTERLRYLKGKHDRDVAQLQVERARIETERAAAKLDVLRGECFDSKDGNSQGGGQGDGKGGESSLSEYDVLGCALVRKNKDIASVDLDYAREKHDAIAELRSREFATEQSLILAKYDVERAEAKLTARNARVAECKKPKTRAKREPALTEAEASAER